MPYSRPKLLAHKQLRRLGTALQGGVRPELEAVYQRIFDRDIERLGVANEFYPVGSASNYGLMYLITRLIQSFRFRKIVELGAGQTTILLDAFKRCGIFEGTAITVEHDEFWKDFIQAKVGHELKLTPLSNTRFTGGYDFANVSIPSEIELLLIDGPPAAGAEYLSRLSALPLVDLLNESGFVIVVDDAERPGESELVERIGEVLRGKNLNYRIGEVIAAKRQTVIGSGKFESAAFF